MVLQSGGSPFGVRSDQADAFGRFRTSQPFTLFDSKLLFDKQPLLWAEKITNGSGNAASTHGVVNASVTMHAESGDTIIRQTWQRLVYQPGKSQYIAMTGVIGAGATGVIKRLGLFTGTDGIFFEQNGTTLGVAIRKNSSDTLVTQGNWNIDKMDGTGPSGVNFDPTKVQIFVIDFQWLGTGRVRLGLNIEGRTHYIHQFVHANLVTSVYMSSPNLPLRYEISSTSGIGELVHICTVVSAEGGREKTELTFTESTSGVHVAAATADIVYAVIGLRLKTTHLGVQIRPVHVSMIVEGQANDFEWLVLLDPVVAGTFTYANRTNSAIQVAKGATANTITGGTQLLAGFGSRAELAVDNAFEQSFVLGADVDNIPNEMVLCVRPLSNNQNVQGAISWREVI